MTGTKQEFISLNLSCVHLSVKIVDGTHSPVLKNGIVQATPSLTLTDVLYVHDFLLVSYLLASLLNIITVK